MESKRNVFDGSTFDTRYLYYGLVALAVVLVVGAAAFNVINVSQEKRSTQWVAQTQQVQTAINELVAEYAETESSGLRYLLSGRADFLARYRKAMSNLDPQVDRVIELVSDTPEQVERLESLREEMGQRQQMMRTLIDTAQVDGVAVAAEIIRRGGEVEFGDQVRWLAAKLQYEEARRLQERQLGLDAAIVQKNATMLLVNGLALVAGIIGLLAIRHSHRALQDQQLAELRAERAMHASDEKSRFLANMSHEIRTPMNAVFGYSELLSKMSVGPRAREYIKAIQTSGSALLALINDILDLSRIESGKLILDPAPTDVRSLMDATLAMFADAAGRKQLQLRGEVTPEVPTAIILDSDRLRQILINLVSNAVKYTDSGGVHVRIHSMATDTPGSVHLVIDVKDSGIGIDVEHQRRLFEPFYRAVEDAEEEATREGTGLGLSIVRRLLELMNGNISLTSQCGTGSTFRVTLSNVETAEVDELEADDATADVDFNRLTPARLLIVDDVSWNRELLASFIGEGVHEIAMATNGVEAVRMVEEFEPDVVLMDLRMPQMDGRTATRHIRRAATGDQPRVVVVTASSLAERDESANSIFDGYIRKPVSRRALYEALREQLGERPLDSVTNPMRNTAERVAVDDEVRLQTRAELQALVEEELPDVVATLRVHAVRSLADDLVELGERGQFSSIRKFGERLYSAQERYDMTTMESLLQQLPDYVASIEDPTASDPGAEVAKSTSTTSSADDGETT